MTKRAGFLELVREKPFASQAAPEGRRGRVSANKWVHELWGRKGSQKIQRGGGSSVRRRGGKLA